MQVLPLILLLTSDPCVQDAVPLAEPAAAHPGPELPPSPAAVAWAGVPAGTAPAPLLLDEPLWPGSFPSPAGLRALDHPAWAEAELWSAWSALVERARDRREQQAPTRAALCRAALAMGRERDAWAHFEACAGAPAELVALLPRLWPGIAAEQPLLADGRPAPLPEGALLCPSLPPPGFHVERFTLQQSKLRYLDLEVGAAHLDLELSQELDGVELRVRHRSGADTSLRLVIPAPEGLEIAIEYVDWERQLAAPGAPLELQLRAGDEDHILWGRYRPEPTLWPRPGALPRPAQLRLAGVELCGPVELSVLGPLAQAFERLLEVPVEVQNGRVLAPRDFAPLRIDLFSPERRAQKLASMVSQVEALCLAP